MKKMTMTLAMIALTSTLSTMALSQTGERNKPGTSVQPSNVEDLDGSPIGHIRGITGSQHNKVIPPQVTTQGTTTREFDKGYISPYALKTYRGTTSVNQGTLNSLSLNGGSGNDKIHATTKDCRRTFKDCTGPFGYRQVNGNPKTSGTSQRNNFLEGDPDQPIVVGSVIAKAQHQNQTVQSNYVGNARRNQTGFLTTVPNGPTYTPVSQNSTVALPSFQQPRQPKNILTASTYGRGSFAKSRRKQGR